MKRVFVFSTFLMIGAVVYSFGEDPYDKLATQLAEYSSSVKKLAIIPFSYADNTASTKDGSIISERLTMKFINMQKFEIIERSVLNKVLDELKLQNSGLIDASSAKELGKVLGADAIITGTLIPTADGKIEVNARVIKTDTAQAIGASQVYVVKDWIGGDVVQTQKPLYQENLKQKYEQTSPAKTSPQQESPFEYGFFEVIGGAGSGTIDVKVNDNAYIFLRDIRWLELKNLTARGIGPIGIRFGRFGSGIMGLDMEISLSRSKTQDQNIIFTNGAVRNMPEGYIDVTSFGISGDLLLRTLTKLQLYLGLGIGLSMNTVKSQSLSTYITDIYGNKLDETDIGFIYRALVGLRYNIDNTTFFLEIRSSGNSMFFDRGSGYETNDLDITGPSFCFGVGSKF